MKSFLIKYVMSFPSTDYTPEEYYAVAKAESHAKAVEQLSSDLGNDEEHLNSIHIDLLDAEDCNTIDISKTLYEDCRRCYGLEKFYGKDA